MRDAHQQSIFPERLFALLEESMDNGFGNVIRWLPDGNRFQVLSRELMQEIVLPRYFGTTIWKSFQRQLNLYGFRSVKDPITKERKSDKARALRHGRLFCVFRMLWSYRMPCSFFVSALCCLQVASIIRTLGGISAIYAVQSSGRQVRPTKAPSATTRRTRHP